MAVPNLDGLPTYFDCEFMEWVPLDQKAYLAMNPDAKWNDEAKAQVSSYTSKVTSLLANSLQFPNVSFFAGSGTSLGSVGGPSMWDLWTRTMWLEPDSSEGEDNYGVLHEISEKVLNKVKYLERDNPNIEQFLSQCEAYLQFNDDDVVRDHIRDIKETIVHECTDFIKQDLSNISPYVNLLKRLARRRTRDPRLQVFTTNYDLCFEFAASKLGMMLIDGFSYTKQRRFNGKYFEYDVVRRENDSHDFVEGVVKLHKLHGSVSWCRQGTDIVEDEGDDAKDIAIIYPAKGKYQQAFVQPYLELLSRFFDTIRKPNTCLLISGFGFNDDHLSEPILSAATSNPSLKLVIADRNLASNIEKSQAGNGSPYWKKFYELSKAGSDIALLNMDFEFLSESIPNLKALTPAEQLANALSKNLTGKLDV